MVRTAPPAIRRALIERAATMLAQREAVTLRSLVAPLDVSTMAVYTHFGGMDGLWRAVRQEGFTRLADALAAVERTDDPVRDLVALGAAYTATGLAHPTLYRAMFDGAADLEDPDAADASFQALVTTAERARDAGRFAADAVPLDVATRIWVYGHGLVSLVVAGVLPPEALTNHVPEATVALLVAAGDHPDRCHRSVMAGLSREAVTQPIPSGDA